MVQIIPQSDFGSSFGQGLGHGLSEQIPTEVNRYRLSQGLKNLGQQDLKSSNPFDLLSKLSSVPGMSPEMIQYALPLLQQQMQRNAAINYGMEQPSKNTPLVSNTNNEISDKGKNQPDRSNYLLPLNPDQINQKIAQYAQDPRFAHKSPDEIRSFVEKEDSNRLANEKSFEDRIKYAENRFNQKLGEKGAETLGKYTSTFRDRVSQRIENGESPNVAADDESAKALKLSEARTQFDVLSNKMIAGQPKQIKKALNSLRDDYKKADALELFRDDLISKEGLTAPAANLLAYPVEENKKLISEINKLKPKAVKTPSRSFEEANLVRAREAIKQLEPYITPQDSIYSIANELSKKGFDEDAVISALKERSDDIGLNSRQQKEFSDVKNWFPSLADFFLFTMAGETL